MFYWFVHLVSFYSFTLKETEKKNGNRRITRKKAKPFIINQSHALQLMERNQVAVCSSNNESLGEAWFILLSLHRLKKCDVKTKTTFRKQNSPSTSLIPCRLLGWVPSKPSRSTSFGNSDVTNFPLYRLFVPDNDEPKIKKHGGFQFKNSALLRSWRLIKISTPY